VNQKAQISLEYILIALSIVVILSLIVIQATSLYSKNIRLIDDRELKYTYEKIQGNIDIGYLLENYYEEINITPRSDWNIKRINDYKYTLSNENKEYLIESLEKIDISFRDVKKETTIVIKKENKKIYIEKK